MIDFRLILAVVALALCFSACKQLPEEQGGQDPAQVVEPPGATIEEDAASDGEGTGFDADDEIRLVDIHLPENKKYADWLNDHNSRVSAGWPLKSYLTENACILMEDTNLYYVNEQTGDKRLILEGGIDENGFEYDVYFEERIDEHRFIYQNTGWRDHGAGIYDISDFSDHPIMHSAGEWKNFVGLYGDHAYMRGVPLADDSQESWFTRVDINTYETSPLMPGLPEDDGIAHEFYTCSGFTPDGKIFAVAVTERGGVDDYRGSVLVYDVDSQERLAEFAIHENKIAPFVFTHSVENNSFYVVSSGFQAAAGKYILEIDISGLRG